MTQAKALTAGQIAEIQKRQDRLTNVPQGDFGFSYEDSVQLHTDCAALLAHLQATSGWRGIPDGYKLVPIEPTEEMHSAAANVPILGPQATARRYRTVEWHAMVAAAPAPTGKETI